MYKLFPKVNEKLLFWLLRSSTYVFCVHEKQYKEPTFLIHAALSVSEASLLRDQPSDGWFWISGHTAHTETESLLRTDTTSSPCWLQYRPLWRETVPPRNCRYPIPPLGERTFEERRGRGHHSITEGNQNSRVPCSTWIGGHFQF